MAGYCYPFITGRSTVQKFQQFDPEIDIEDRAFAGDPLLSTPFDGGALDTPIDIGGVCGYCKHVIACAPNCHYACHKFSSVNALFPIHGEVMCLFPQSVFMAAKTSIQPTLSTNSAGPSV